LFLIWKDGSFARLKSAHSIRGSFGSSACFFSRFKGFFWVDLGLGFGLGRSEWLARFQQLIFESSGLSSLESSSSHLNVRSYVGFCIRMPSVKLAGFESFFGFFCFYGFGVDDVSICITSSSS
jgi:hypothetical protein